MSVTSKINSSYLWNVWFLALVMYLFECFSTAFIFVFGISWARTCIWKCALYWVVYCNWRKKQYVLIYFFVLLLRHSNLVHTNLLRSRASFTVRFTNFTPKIPLCIVCGQETILAQKLQEIDHSVLLHHSEVSACTLIFWEN